MSTVTGGQGNIVTNGLILNLDAANPRSYPQPYNGTTWSNLVAVSSSLAGSLVNGVGYTGSNGGALVFDGTNDYTAMTGNTFNYSPGTTGELTLEAWVYATGPFSTYPPENITAIGGIIGQGIYNNTTGWGLGIQRAGAGSFQYEFQTRNVSIASITTKADFTTGSWSHVVGSFTRNDFSRIYLNGNLAGSASSTPYNGITLTPNINDAAIGRAGGSNFSIGGRVAIGRLYNRPLTSTEVLQNFNATRARFGV
jgi:hypothetical protein